MIVNANPKSDAQWYFEEFSEDRERLYDIFFDMGKKFNVSWSKATPKQKAFVEEITRFTFEREKALE